jgi:hypothetical protein
MLAFECDEERTQRAEAEQFLKDILANGRVDAADVVKRSRQLGISDRTRNRAKKALDIKSEKEGQPGTPEQRWYWRLPEPKIATVGKRGNLRAQKEETQLAQ